MNDERIARVEEHQPQNPVLDPERLASGDSVQLRLERLNQKLTSGEVLELSLERAQEGRKRFVHSRILTGRWHRRGSMTRLFNSDWPHSPKTRRSTCVCSFA